MWDTNQTGFACPYCFICALLDSIYDLWIPWINLSPANSHHTSLKPKKTMSKQHVLNWYKIKLLIQWIFCTYYIWQCLRVFKPSRLSMCPHGRAKSGRAAVMAYRECREEQSSTTTKEGLGLLWQRGASGSFSLFSLCLFWRRRRIRRQSAGSSFNLTRSCQSEKLAKQACRSS